MKIREITVKSIIAKSKLPDCDYTINPYVGCMHKCIYCYARYMKNYTNHQENWGDFVDIKINAHELILKNKLKFNKKIFFLSSVTDPYIPLEEKYMITRKILENLVQFQPHICIQTKSSLVLRDLDLIKKFKNVEVGFTITSLNEKIRKEIEPHTSTVNEKLNALLKLKNENIKNYIFIGPILPYFTNWKQIILKTKNFVDEYIFENLNVSNPEVWSSVKNWILNFHPKILNNYEDFCFSNLYWEKIKNEIINFCEEHKIKYKLYFHYGRKISDLKL